MIEKTVDFCKKHIKGAMIIWDLISVIVAFVAASYLKFDAPNMVDRWFDENMFIILVLDFAVTLIAFGVSKIYKLMWQYFVIADYLRLAKSFVISKVITCVAFSYIWLFDFTGAKYTRSFLTWMFLYSMLSFGFFVFGRFSVLSFYKEMKKFNENKKGEKPGSRTRVMIVGAGNAAFRLIEEIRSTKFSQKYNVVALIDDNMRKHGEFLGGVKIYGGRDKIEDVAAELDIDEIFFAIPSIKEDERKAILDICNKTGCVLKTVPSLAQMGNSQNISQTLRKVDYTDLLGREQIKPDLTGAFKLLEGKTVFVSGGGGSIGSELVRQVANSKAAKRIIIFDIAENGAYEIQQEIRRKHPDVDLKVLIGSVRDEKRLCEVFEEYRPDFVYHAAAHKHVPLMEDSPKEAVKNNVFGTLNLATVADKYGVQRFVMISTDKAVNPTNVMGATKRICEMIVQSFNQKSKTEFVCVRFGNVLGSNGSVIPLFKEQIENGGPVTVTHPDIIRYFMLIPEAVSLVLQAGANAKGGEIFILDMGSPVKIRELAENLIRISGYTPGVDMEIKYTGLRDGEKLYEELLISEEGIQKTANDLIYVAKPMDIDTGYLFSQISYAKEIMENATGCEIVEIIKTLVPTFNPQNEAYKNSVDNEKETVKI